MADNTLGLYTPRLSDTFDQFARRKSPYRLDFSYIQQGEKSWEETMNEASLLFVGF